MSVKLSTGAKKKSYKSIREASNVTGIPYITLYMRVKKLGWPISKACRAAVRPYERKDTVAA